MYQDLEHQNSLQHPGTLMLQNLTTGKMKKTNRNPTLNLRNIFPACCFINLTCSRLLRDVSCSKFWHRQQVWLILKEIREKLGDQSLLNVLPAVLPLRQHLLSYALQEHNRSCQLHPRIQSLAKQHNVKSELFSMKPTELFSILQNVYKIIISWRVKIKSLPCCALSTLFPASC